MDLKGITKTKGGAPVRDLTFTGEFFKGALLGLEGGGRPRTWDALGRATFDVSYVSPGSYDLDLGPINRGSHVLPKQHINAGKDDVIAFCEKNGLSFTEGSVVKYVAQHRSKNGLADLRQAEQYLKRLIETYEDTN
jgi:hypothetical protein